MKLFRALLAIALSPVLLAGCSMVDGMPSAKPVVPDDNSTGSVAPVAIEVKNAFVAGGKLHVQILLTAMTQLPSDSVAVYVRGLKDGSVVSEDVRRAADVSEESMIAAGARLAFQFELDSAGITEYQAACSWGDEAKPFLASAAPAPISDRVPSPAKLSSEPTVEAQEVRLAKLETESQEISCESPPCDVMYVISGEIVNGTPFRIANLRLGLSVNWAEAGAPPSVPEEGTDLQPHEQDVSLGEVRLEAGQSRKIRVSLDKPIPVLDSGAFVPHLRIVDYTRVSTYRAE